MKKLACLSFCLWICLILRADEGMWMLHNLSENNLEKMKSLGFTLSFDELYSEQNPSLKDAVVHFDGGCTGITVSGEGLIFTNHHCGYEAIQSQSSVENDYLANGFVAQTKEEEIPVPGMIIRYLVHTENVTGRLLNAVDTMLYEDSRLKKIEEISKFICDSLMKDKPFLEAEINAYFNDNTYYLNIYQVFHDIRMVFAPPSSVGKFGGDTDNWMWPRHTGDFSVFRVYAGTDNEPAEYNEQNVPYRPKSFVRVSLDGYKDQDYSMTIGFPGRTKRYLSSWGINQRVEFINKPRIEVRGIKQDIWNEAMLNNDEIRIKYSSKYARSSNYWKNSIGMNRGIERMQVMERKQSLEKKFAEWVDQDEDRKKLYGETLSLMEEGYRDTDEMQQYFTYLYETLLSGSELSTLSFIAMGYDPNESEENRRMYLENELLPAYKDYDPALDQQVLAAMIKIVKEKVPEPFCPHILKDIDKKYKGDYNRYAEDVFKKSVIPYVDKLGEVLKDPKKIKKLDKDPAYQWAKSVRESIEATFVGIQVLKPDLQKGERLFFAGLQQMMPDKDFAPDANSTMRVSYGRVGGYVPYDGAWYDYYTTQQGVFEKYRKGDPEFDVQPEILGLLHSGDFGQYANPAGDLNLCFISNNDITGGNSGSPMFDGQGNLIGLAFDGNWEAMSGDIVFEPEIQKTIGVDIRYVLFIIDRWGKCNRLLEELQLIKR